MRNRLGYIDTGRGLAAIMVLIFHSVLWFFASAESGLGADTAFLFNEYFDLGKISVLVFFIISGLVIPYSIKGNASGTIKKFVLSRFFRLYPVYWVSAIGGFLLFGGFSFTELLANFTMLQQFFGIRNIIGLYWTLQIELVFYFLIVLVFLIKKLSDVKFLFFVSLAFLFISIFFAFIRGYFALQLPLALPMALSLMFFGSFYRYYLLGDDNLANKLSNVFLIAYLVSVPVICKLGYSVDFGQHENWVKYTITYYVGVGLFLLMGKFKISSGITEYLGRISYSVYLFHPLLIFIFYKYPLFGKVPGMVKVGLVLVSTIIVSHFLYKLVEAPSISLGRKLKGRIQNKE